jgi:hypothetical protein
VGRGCALLLVFNRATCTQHTHIDKTAKAASNSSIASSSSGLHRKRKNGDELSRVVSSAQPKSWQLLVHQSRLWISLLGIARDISIAMRIIMQPGFTRTALILL